MSKTPTSFRMEAGKTISESEEYRNALWDLLYRICGGTTTYNIMCEVEDAGADAGHDRTRALADWVGQIDIPPDPAHLASLILRNMLTEMLPDNKAYKKWERSMGKKEAKR